MLLFVSPLWLPHPVIRRADERTAAAIKCNALFFIIILADNGEGDTNGFYDDGGTWITVHKNSQGQWVDESGMTYQFGDDGVTDQNGVFYPY